MANTKKRQEVEMYEEYWKFTAAWTDIMGAKFNNNLRVVLDYIDQNRDEIDKIGKNEYDFSLSNVYSELQYKIATLNNFIGKDATLSARKALNEFVKLGFVFPFLQGYHQDSRNFVNETNIDKKKILFSKIFYDNASLNSGVTKDNRELKHMKFFLTTLDKNKTLDSKDIIALMCTNITQYSKGYLTRDDLNFQYRYAQDIGFEDRKYNQIAHLTSILKNFVDLKYDEVAKKFYFADDTEYVELEREEALKRDGVRHRIYKNELFALSNEVYGKKVCFYDKKEHKVLIASHIKPWKQCILENDEDSAYNPENGLLLSLEIDSYFDKFNITFNNNGYIVLGKGVPQHAIENIDKNCIDKIILNDRRKEFLKYHQERFKKENGVENV